MSYNNLKIDKDGAVAIVTIDRPKALNALNDETVGELHSCFTELGNDDSIRCIVLTGGGEKAFVAGADISELAKLDRAGGMATATKGQGALFVIEQLSKPVIAAVNGFALGGGCELAMACDIRLASENAKLGQPEINLGILPGYGGTQRLSRLVGYGKAMQLTLTGDMIDAAEAHRIGLVDEVYPLEDLMDKAKKIASKIAAKGPLALKAIKEAINTSVDVDLDSGCKKEAELFADICETADCKEGLNAFLEKRKAVFTGK